MRAIDLFNKIGVGKENAVKRPGNQHEDRELRRMIADANTAGDCIISGKTGYYRPNVFRPDENAAADRILAAELHRARSILHKRLGMKKGLKVLRECQLTAGKKESAVSGNWPESSASMVLDVDEGSSIPGQMVMRM